MDEELTRRCRPCFTQIPVRSVPFLQGLRRKRRAIRRVGGWWRHRPVVVVWLRYPFTQAGDSVGESFFQCDVPSLCSGSCEFRFGLTKRDVIASNRRPRCRPRHQ
jgi:hypothetical protein